MNNSLFSKVFLWMAAGLLVTFATGYFITLNENMLRTIYTNGAYIVFAIIELVLVIALSARVTKMKPTTCKVMFLLYSFVSGLTFSSIFITYKMSSIMYVFLAASLVFMIFALIGYTTKVDLSKIGTYLFIGLFIAIIAVIVNIFLNIPALTLILSIVIIFIFMGITAYDIQKIKQLKDLDINEDNLAIYGALQLYLDFINIFIHLLSIFGRDN